GIKSQRSLLSAQQQNNQWITLVEGEKKVFEAKARELNSLKRQYENLPNERAQKITNLERNARERQLEKFLDKFQLQRVKISDIGDVRKATLASYGIETAADIVASKIEGVIPGFGPVYTSKLVAWRTGLEGFFTFDPSKGVDSADINAIDQEITLKKRRIQTELMSGPIRLKQIVEKIIHWQEQIQREGMQISEKRIKVTASEEYLRAFRYWFAPLWLLTIMSAFI